MNSWTIWQWQNYKWEVVKNFRSLKKARAFAKDLAIHSFNRYDVRITAPMLLLWRLQNRRGKKSAQPVQTFLNKPLDVILYHKEKKTLDF